MRKPGLAGIDIRRGAGFPRGVKTSLLLAAAAVISLTSCTTLENRRDLYNPQKVEGPYTRMLGAKKEKEKTYKVITTKVVTKGSRSSSDGKSVVR